jgi:hypothetical protein
MFTVMKNRNKTRTSPERKVERRVKDKLKEESLRRADMQRLAVMSTHGKMSEEKITVA